MENTRTLATVYKDDLKHLLSRLIRIGYTAQCQSLDTADYGAPQHRERLYLMAVLSARPAAVWWPPKFGKCIPIKQII